MSDIRQSVRYARFMQNLGWLVEEIDGVLIFIKPFPFIGATFKIQRADKLPDVNKLRKLMKKYHCRSISFELNIAVIPNSFRDLKDFEMQKSSQSEIPLRVGQVQHDKKLVKFKPLKDPYLPTKTMLIDLTASETIIFNRFSDAKRRAVRRAEKVGVAVKESHEIADFIKLKNKTAGLLGFLTTSTLKPLWQTFASNNASILLACRHSERSEESLSLSEPLAYARDPSTKFIPIKSGLGMTEHIAGILLLFHNKTAYYWIAAATEAGKKSFAPTLLVWESLKLAKQKGCIVFDFEGIYDERYPNLNKNWLGFTKFKSGFGGKELDYPQPLSIK